MIFFAVAGLNGRFRFIILNVDFWQATFQLSAGAIPDSAIIYNYILRNADGSSVRDWGSDHIIHPASFKLDEILIIDSWNYAGSVENAFYTEPFKKVLLQPNHAEVRLPAKPGATHTFKVKGSAPVERPDALPFWQWCRVGQLEHRRSAFVEPD